MAKEKRKKTFGDFVRTIIMIIALCVFAYSAYQLFTIFMEYKSARDEYIDIAGEVFPEKSADDGDEPSSGGPDFDVLLKINPDVVGWIKFDEPKIIDYPIVKGTDNDYYLTHTFKKEENSSGAIFMDFDNNKNFDDPNTFIYGHNMKDKSMFNQIKNYRDKSYWEENPYFYIYTLDGRTQKYEIFSAYVVDAYADSYTKWFEFVEGYKEYLDLVKRLSNYDTGTELKMEDQIVSLSTCTSRTDDERFLVHGKLITEDE